MSIEWQTHPDPERPGCKLRIIELADNATLTVSETSIGEWSWVVSDSDGWPTNLRHGFLSEREAMDDSIATLAIKEG